MVNDRCAMQVTDAYRIIDSVLLGNGSSKTPKTGATPSSSTNGAAIESSYQAPLEVDAAAVDEEDLFDDEQTSSDPDNQESDTTATTTTSTAASTTTSTTKQQADVEFSIPQLNVCRAVVRRRCITWFNSNSAAMSRFICTTKQARSKFSIWNNPLRHRALVWWHCQSHRPKDAYVGGGADKNASTVLLTHALVCVYHVY
jgi:hypothetical protein